MSVDPQRDIKKAEDHISSLFGSGDRARKAIPKEDCPIRMQEAHKISYCYLQYYLCFLQIG